MAQPLWSITERNERTERERNRALFEGRHEYTLSSVTKGRKVKRRYVCENLLGDMLTRKMSELVFPTFPTITVNGTAEQQAAVDRLIADMELEDITQQTAITISYASSALWKVGWDDGPAVALWGNNGNEYFTWTGPKRKPHSVTCWYFVGEGDKAVCISETHQLGMTYAYDLEGHPVTATGEGLVIISQAWQVKEGTPVNLPVAWANVPWPAGFGIPLERIELPGIDTLPVAIIDNVDLDGDGKADSDYTPSLINIQSALNDVLSIRQAVIDYCEFPAIQMSEALLEDGAENTEVSFNDAMFSIEADDGVPLAKKQKIRIDGWTGNLENSGAQYTYLIDAFHRLSGMSKVLFGQELSGADSGYARRLALMSVERGVNARRARYTPAFLTVLRSAMLLEQYYQRSTVTPVESITTEWEPVVPEDTNAEEAKLTTQAKAGIRSLKNTIASLHPKWSAEEIAAEYATIMEERMDLHRVTTMKSDGSAVE